MDKRGGRDQAVADGPRIGDVEQGAAPRHGRVDGQNAIGENAKHVIVEPGAEQRALGAVASLGEKHANLQFLDHDDREEQDAGRRVTEPGGDAPIGLSRPNLAQFGQDVGVEQKHQSSGADLAGSRIG